MEYLLAAFATFTLTIIFQSFLPCALPSRLAPLVVIGLALLVLLVLPHVWVTALAVSGAVALIHKLAVGAPVEPWSVHLLPWLRRRSERPQARQRPVGKRMPKL